jgi:heme A synthase
VAFLVTLLRSNDADAAERNLSKAGLALLAVQIGVGAFSALESTHTELADLHLAFAMALWGVIVAVFALTARGRQWRAHEVVEPYSPNEPNSSRILS